MKAGRWLSNATEKAFTYIVKKNRLSVQKIWKLN